ncbi:hypothetical protein, partial [Methanoculleus chikugoensis]|uniref:hypothetical protein n=1 Tax=Methanoculleus chikugoensis TaxID=118126 RepID=UPI0006D12FFC
MGPEWIRRRGPVILLAVCLLALSAGQAGARGPAINDIQPYDTIFVYEEGGLDLSQLRDPATNNSVTELRKYQNDDPPNRGGPKEASRSLTTRTSTCRTSTWMRTTGHTTPSTPPRTGDGAGHDPRTEALPRCGAREPPLPQRAPPGRADRLPPEHPDSLQGIRPPDVGRSTRRAASTRRRSISCSPHRAVRRRRGSGGVNLAGLNVSSTRFYTDDPPARPGAVRLGDIGRPGTYSVRAVWRTPSGFDAYAPDSKPVTFTVANRVGVDTTATPIPTATVTATPTATPTTAPPRRRF